MCAVIGGEVAYGVDSVATSIHQRASTQRVIIPDIVLSKHALWRAEESVDGLDSAELARIKNGFQADDGGMEAVVKSF